MVIERDDAGRVVRVDVYEPPRGVSVESRDGSEGGKSSRGGAPLYVIRFTYSATSTATSAPAPSFKRLSQASVMELVRTEVLRGSVTARLGSRHRVADRTAVLPMSRSSLCTSAGREDRF